MRSKLLLVFVILLIFQAEFKCHGEEPTSENPLEATTKKSGFFKGIKKFFGGGSGKTTEEPVTSTSTTTAKSTATTPRPTTKPTVRLPPQQHYPGDLPGFPPRQQPEPNKPGLTALSYPSTKPPANAAPIAPLAPMQPITSSTTTTTTTKPTTKVEVKSSSTTTTTTTTTKKPATKDDFPTLPTKKTAFVPTPSGSPNNAWSTPLTPTPASNGNQPNKVSFITTPKTNLPTPSTTHRPSGSEKLLATDDELAQVSETIFSKETNSKLANLHLDLQGKTKSFETKDEAPKPLFNPDEQALRSNSIIKMLALFNNYELDTTVNEFVTPLERSEENQFLDIIMVSGVMRQAMLFLQNKGLVSPDPAKHRELVKTIWFTMYSRGLGKIGSSAFEHVFLNEIKNGTVIGLHNWVYFLEQEKAGKVDYMGYIKKVDLGNKAAVVVSRFSYNGIMKPVNGMFVGTSPELEIALYTLCFQLRPDQDCPLILGGEKVNIVTHTWKYRGNKLIGSAYPEV